MVGRLNPNWIVPTAPRGTSDNRAASTAFVTQGGAGPRIVLASATTFYVATNGSDSNNGLTSGTPWATFAHAMSVITGQYDFGGQAVTLQAVTGHASFTEKFNITSWIGGGSFTYDGAGGSVSVANDTAFFSGSSFGQIPTTFTIQNVTIGGGTTTFGVNLRVPGTLSIGTGIIFDTCSSAQISCAVGGGKILTNNSYAILGQASAHITVQFGGLITGTGITVDIQTAALNFSNAFASTNMVGQLFLNGVTYANNAASVTGIRAIADTNSVINTNGGGANFFPGNAAFQTPNGGRYL